MASPVDDGFSSNHLLLKPEEVSLLDLIKILFSNDLEQRKFVDSAEAKEESFERRWLVFVSIVAQKLLQFVSKPLSSMGSLTEMWLNLLSSNLGFGRLLLNVLRGKVAVPDKTSASYISFTGNYDLRTELDRNIQREDPRYLAELSVMASKLSYENKANIESTVKEQWEMEVLGSYDFWNDYQGKATTQACLIRDKTNEQDTIVVAFRGTEPFDADAWCSDIDLSWYELPGIGRVHCGFLKALGLQKCNGWPKETKQDSDRPAPLAYYAIRDMLRELLSRNDKARYVVTGHSLGGALAILFPAVLVYHEDKLLLERLDGIYTFGQPRVGDQDFGKYMDAKLKENGIEYYRVVYGSDIVPRLPYDNKALMFKHFGRCIYYDRHYEAQVVAEEPNKNYFSPVEAISMNVNAGFELIRSFTISRRRGRDFREGWLLRMFRFMGLIVPGVPPHLIQDYMLQSIAKPLAWVGSKIEMWLNLISCNRNIFMLFINFIRGGVVWPVKESETFMSVLGHLDKRLQLDERIKPGNCRYWSALSVMASKISYENKAFVENTVKNHWKIFNKNSRHRASCFMTKMQILTEWLWSSGVLNLLMQMRGVPILISPGTSSRGWAEFMEALGLIMKQGWPLEYEQEDSRPIAYYTIRDQLRKILKQNDRTQFILTGHSMGGAIACIFPAVLAMHKETWLLKRLEGVYTFGQPRVGDEEFRRFMHNQMQTYGFKYLRFVYSNDVVPRLPIDDDSTFSFKHFGPCVYYNSCYRGKIVTEEPDKNYTSTFAPIARFFVAIWELIRSFILPYKIGPEYEETWFLKLLRWYGLILPGLIAHNPQDYYVSSTSRPAFHHECKY
ncbi:hypothetical protein Tsubulata_029322, partial [Turnera subulata]